MAIINGTKTLVGNREHKKTLGGGGQGNKSIYYRGTREQVSSWVGPGGRPT